MSFNKIFFARPEIKHTNNKAIITLYTFNREKIGLLKKMRILSYLTGLLLFNLRTSGSESMDFLEKKKLIKLDLRQSQIRRVLITKVRED